MDFGPFEVFRMSNICLVRTLVVDMELLDLLVESDLMLISSRSNSSF